MNIDKRIWALIIVIIADIIGIPMYAYCLHDLYQFSNFQSIGIATIAFGVVSLIVLVTFWKQLR